MLRTQDKRLQVGQDLAEIVRRYVTPLHETIGVSTASTRGTLVTANASAHTKGSWAELSAATTRDANSFSVFVPRLPSGGMFMLDIGLGAAGSEVTLVENLAFDVSSSSEAPQLLVPLPIPAGSRVAARIQSSPGGKTVDCYIVLHRERAFSGLGLRRATTYGADTATTSGVQLAWGGAAHTKGAWAELSASMTNDARLLLLIIGLRNASMTAERFAAVDLGVGGAGSEQVLVADLFACGNTAGDRYYPDRFLVPVSLQAGTRLVARAQYAANADLLDAIAIGFD